MDKWFQSKWFVRIISLIFAVSLYLFVTVETDMTKGESPVVPGATTEIQVLDDVPLDIRIDSDQYVVSGVPEFVTVSLEGKTSVLTPIVRQRNFNVFIDLRDLEEGEHTVEVEHENIPKELTAFIEPKTIDVVIEKRATEQFSVHVEYVNRDQLPIGYEVGEAEINPTTVQITSSESVIDKIAMVKVYIDLKDLKESIVNREVPVSVYDIQGNELNANVEPESVTVSVPVERPSKTVPLNIETEGKLPDGFEIDKIVADEEIEIFGTREVLSKITEMTTEPLNLQNVKESGVYEVELDFPEGVIANDETIEVTVELIETKEFKNVPIDVRGNDSVTFVRPNDGRVNVEIFGSDRTIKELTKDDFSPLINVGNLEEGEHEVTIEINDKKGVTIELQFERATIRID